MCGACKIGNTCATAQGMAIRKVNAATVGTIATGIVLDVSLFMFSSSIKRFNR